MAQEILGPEDLPVSEGDELPEFLIGLDASRAASHVEVTEDQNRLAKVLNLLNRFIKLPHASLRYSSHAFRRPSWPR